MRVVLDTNVVISALNFPGNEHLVLEPALRGRFELCLSQFILEEVAGVMVRRVGWEEEPTAQALSVHETTSSHGHRTPTPSGGDTWRSLRQPGVGKRPWPRTPTIW